MPATITEPLADIEEAEVTRPLSKSSAQRKFDRLTRERYRAQQQADKLRAEAISLRAENTQLTADLERALKLIGKYSEIFRKRKVQLNERNHHN